jgi:hypothetical protein
MVMTHMLITQFLEGHNAKMVYPFMTQLMGKVPALVSNTLVNMSHGFTLFGSF